jgi:hypothetical protein
MVLHGYLMPFLVTMDNIFQHLFEWAQHKYLIGLDIVQDFQAFCFHDLPQLSQFQMPFWKTAKIFMKWNHDSFKIIDHVQNRKGLDN